MRDCKGDLEVRFNCDESHLDARQTLAAEAENWRAEFIQALAQVEKLTNDMTLKIPAIRGNLASNSALAGRMKAVAERLNSGAKRLMRR